MNGYVYISVYMCVHALSAHHALAHAMQRASERSNASPSGARARAQQTHFAPHKSIGISLHAQTPAQTQCAHDLRNLDDDERRLRRVT